MQRFLDQFRLDPRPGAPSHRLTRDLVVRGLGLVHVIAFLSLWVQVTGLIGRAGLLPAGNAAVAVAQTLGWKKFLALPSLFWLYPTDGMLHAMCAAGVMLGVAVVIGLFQGPALLLLWVLYLSLFTASQLFLAFQWDLLLLEATFLALLVAPWGMWAHRAPEPAPLGLTLFRALFLKLMFLTGLVKVVSGDPAWRDFTALSYHYLTQPLPNPLSWYLHQAPLWFHQVSVALVFAVELVLPWLFLFGRKPRMVALVGTLVVVAGAQVSGNVGFFHLLTAVIALSLLDDEVLRRLVRIQRRGSATVTSTPRPSRGYFVGLFATLLLCLNGILLWALAVGPSEIPAWGQRILVRTQPWRLANVYGPFPTIPQTRPEVVFEGSEDGTTWVPYTFRYTPTDPTRKPPLVAPHQPRLDWMMHIAAQQTCGDHLWVTRMMERLVEGSAPVTGLFLEDPFPEGPPRYVRSTVWTYRFTAPGEDPEAWWVREGPAAEYCPQVSWEE
ncbi:MAG: lipase maturation factor family protein [Deltaproteobacteria bacterium]|nr:lipase maturation factor family protein [Deltaproteobacteria bacterium]